MNWAEENAVLFDAKMTEKVQSSRRKKKEPVLIKVYEQMILPIG